MSELVARLAVQQLRNKMFPSLPSTFQKILPLVQDPLVEDGPTQVPNIVVGEYQDFGANAPTPMITVHCDGPQEGIVNVWRHVNLYIDIWLNGSVSGNVDGRRVISVLYEYINRSLQNVNWSGRGSPGSSFVQVQRCYEIERSTIQFEPTDKTYHLANIYKVEAVSQTWY